MHICQLFQVFWWPSFYKEKVAFSDSFTYLTFNNVSHEAGIFSFILHHVFNTFYNESDSHQNHVIGSLEKVEVRSMRSMAKVFGTVTCVGGAVSMAFFKGPRLLNLEMEFHKLATLFHSASKNWIVGSLLLMGSSCCWSLWLVLQVINFSVLYCCCTQLIATCNRTFLFLLCYLLALPHIFMSHARNCGTENSYLSWVSKENVKDACVRVCMCVCDLEGEWETNLHSSTIDFFSLTYSCRCQFAELIWIPYHYQYGCVCSPPSYLLLWHSF